MPRAPQHEERGWFPSALSWKGESDKLACSFSAAEAALTAFVYILRCADGSDYVGSARGESLDRRLGEHQAGTRIGYTSHRRPVTLVYAEWFDRITDAVAAERRIKGWSRAKKEALIAEDWDRVQFLAKRPSARVGLSNSIPSS